MFPPGLCCWSFRDLRRLWEWRVRPGSPAARAALRWPMGLPLVQKVFREGQCYSLAPISAPFPGGQEFLNELRKQRKKSQMTSTERSGLLYCLPKSQRLGSITPSPLLRSQWVKQLPLLMSSDVGEDDLSRAEQRFPARTQGLKGSSRCVCMFTCVERDSMTSSGLSQGLSPKQA